MQMLAHRHPELPVLIVDEPAEAHEVARVRTAMSSACAAASAVSNTHRVSMRLEWEERARPELDSRRTDGIERLQPWLPSQDRR